MPPVQGDFCGDFKTDHCRPGRPAQLWAQVPPRVRRACAGLVLGNRALSLLVLVLWLAGAALLCAKRVHRAEVGSQ